MGCVPDIGFSKSEPGDAANQCHLVWCGRVCYSVVLHRGDSKLYSGGVVVGFMVWMIIVYTRGVNENWMKCIKAKKIR